MSDLHQSEELTAEVISLLQRRAQAASRSLESAEEEAVIWVAEFPVGDETFAIPLGALRSAMPLQRVTPVPLSAPEVIGVVRFQGEALTVFSLASLLGIRGWREDPMVLIVVEPSLNHRVALDCEQIPKPVALSLASYEAARSASADAFVEVTTSDLRQVNVLDVERLLARRRGAA